MVALHNHSEIPYTVSPMDRIAQLIISPYKSVDFEIVEDLDETIRGNGGFNSTGK